LWYLMDVSAFFMRVLMTEEAINAMRRINSPCIGICRFG
jgi:hypothetical protein